MESQNFNLEVPSPKSTESGRSNDFVKVGKDGKMETDRHNGENSDVVSPDGENESGHNENAAIVFIQSLGNCK